MNFDLETATALEKEAHANNGHCTHCGSTIKIYKYKANRTLAIMLRKMADRVKETGNTVVNYDDIPVPHALHSQRAKLRQHGLIYKHKENGHHVANMWGITQKGWNWLKGEPIPTKVIVYNNQVLGHDGGVITIGTALGEKYDPTIYSEIVLSEPEAKTFAQIREPVKQQQMQAEYLGYSFSKLIKGEIFTILIDRMQLGKPVIVAVKDIDQTAPMSYKDIASFGKSWKVI